ncbi:GIY-YIG nuclease family protein [Microbulbifer epialgicus]|uniref:GIY-YIG nuclease family protein n=1 Tax=Microbulbifer epialgicus TaxID=393907 RepID=A0ABV4NXR5_9GAMM
MSYWFVYLVRTSSGSLYTGVTTDVERRFAEHCSSGSRAAKALKGKGPLSLEYQKQVPDKSAALKLEIMIKKWPKQKKESLIAGSIVLPGLSGRDGPRKASKKDTA